jgi:hypothetical protein
VQLTASVNVGGSQHFGNFGQVDFQVQDTGSASTGELTATITLPAGASMLTGGHDGGFGAFDGGFGWSCQPTTTGATCQHAGVGAGAQTSGTIYITISGTSACGQPVQLQAASGSVSASAQSPGGIPCNQGD